jgi:fructokinase
MPLKPITKWTVVGAGELLWDLLPSGKQLGGATANFAYHAHALGANSWAVSRVGSDSLGREILARLAELGLPTASVQVDDDAPTGTVSVEMLPGNDHRFTIHEGVAWDRLEATGEALDLAARADAVCFGSLGQRCPAARAAIQAIVAAAPPAALQIFDINLRQQFYSREVIEESLNIANVLKVNDEELPVLAEMLALRGGPHDQLSELAGRYGLTLAALTRGPRGSLLYAGGEFSDLPGIPVTVVDSIGAGDAFTAAMALGWLARWDLDEINRRANAVASFVCTQPGGTPALPSEIVNPYRVS